MTMEEKRHPKKDGSDYAERGVISEEGGDIGTILERELSSKEEEGEGILGRDRAGRRTIWCRSRTRLSTEGG